MNILALLLFETAIGLIILAAINAVPHLVSTSSSCATKVEDDCHYVTYIV